MSKSTVVYGCVTAAMLCALPGVHAIQEENRALATAAGRCGQERWAIKTGTDAGAKKIDLTKPTPTSIAALIALHAPSPIPPATRVASAETTVWVVDGILTDYKIEDNPKTGDSDYHLVLKDPSSNETMIVEIPAPGCVALSSPFKDDVASARTQFDAQFTASGNFQSTNAPVRVTGIGMFDFPHGQRGYAQNGIELHPVLDIQFSPEPAHIVGAPPKAMLGASSAGGSGVHPEIGAGSVPVSARRRVAALAVSFGSIFAVLWLLHASPRRLVLGEDGRYSKSKFQVALWFATVIAGYLATVGLRWWGSGWTVAGGVGIPTDLLVISGISAFTFVGAKQVTVNKMAQSAAFAAAKQTVVPSRFPDDLVNDDAGNPDLGDTQMILITLIAVGTYLMTVFSWLGTLQLAAQVQMPDIGTTLVAVFGLGQGAYLVKKQIGS
jgi:hypothetical protein